MKKTIVFFIRHYNDLDHIVPVLYKLCSSNSFHLCVIFVNRLNENDYRINLVKQKGNIELYHIDDFLSSGDKYSPQIISLQEKLKIYLIISLIRIPVIRKLLKKKPSLKEKKYDTSFIEKIFDSLLNDSSKVLVCFDWIMSTSGLSIDLSTNVVNVAKTRGYTTVSLPHGDSPHLNKMIFDKDLNYKNADIFSPTAKFDYVVVPNQLCANRYERHMDKNRIKILGSPRYNDEWLDFLKRNITPYRNEKGKNKLKIVFFLRPHHFIVFVDEIINNIRLVSQFKQVHLIVVNHSRSVTKVLASTSAIDNDDLSNIEFVSDEIPATALIQWADVVMDLSTSITFEAIKWSKPVLCMENLHGNKSTIAYYMPRTAVFCRDDLYDAIEQLIQNPNYTRYTAEERKRFIDDMIDVPDGNVLNRYIDFLSNLLKD